MKKTILFLLIIGCSATMMAQNVQGYVRCGTAKVAGVAISDGDTVVVTDSDGHYAFESKKRNGYVFCSIPRGYEATMADGFRPQFWQAFRFPTNTALSEYINFTLRAVQNDACVFFVNAVLRCQRHALPTHQCTQTIHGSAVWHQANAPTDG